MVKTALLAPKATLVLLVSLVFKVRKAFLVKMEHPVRAFLLVVLRGKYSQRQHRVLHGKTSRKVVYNLIGIKIILQS